MPVHTADRLMVGCPGVAPGYVDLESTRSPDDPPPTAYTLEESHLSLKRLLTGLKDSGQFHRSFHQQLDR